MSSSDESRPRRSQQERQHPKQNRPVLGRTERDRNRRQFGQNFLHDRKTLARIAEVAELRPDLPVLEVGPGKGLLTRKLASRARQVTSYEIDSRLAKSLREKLSEHRNIEVVNTDFLTTEPPTEPFAFVGAIPYGITSAIVDWCLEAPTIETATMVTQLEFARKRTGDYGRWSRLTVMTWPLFEWEFVEKVDRRLFRPVPKVDSAIIRLRRRSEPLLDGEALERYKSMVELGFTGVGGNIQASLLRQYPKHRVAAALDHASIGGGAVVAYIRPEQWLKLFERLDRKEEPTRGRNQRGERTRGGDHRVHGRGRRGPSEDGRSGGRSNGRSGRRGGPRQR
ncbi:ErmE/ErmH/ErmO/ErmR family 23S rRNA (adenine(2058)-N(6))-methyltransferase [Actinopolyspora erythraea]|uniref:ErmE/ErmH/ErmO/ErmR family 23S rRNA (Adenine(2058)-N(6))-methyltransferase n=1 Tax=Actinopolyspora erythraea TaxID=414996 RepID=A0A099D5H5_9ACTN|nr:ErmE/ErmH/ErmO/ErmR family 23S rRNA (adenine(2058)-N(6))-methyltransferase [Actinopolyspora erythraea]AIS23774.1 N-6-aminoadenine-N-methyltransferase [Actinopolyspora erythraea]ASU79074.1 ErmE/ErmH/ErmO/ErmR family 23S rRNA (adenine(2058)-N(6))-methyltransferase [Actinopolyspora erythraea]KGI81196.1 SAM-dependent methyltransferase [Actinopolyspora erythraea]